MAAKWYRDHLKGHQADGEELRVVLLTNDVGNKQKAAEENLLVYKCEALVSGNICFDLRGYLL